MLYRDVDEGEVSYVLLNMSILSEDLLRQAPEVFVMKIAIVTGAGAGIGLNAVPALKAGFV